jgi:hypothetical protein
MRYKKPIGFEWDKNNKLKNWEKHKVDFRECEQLFFNRPIKTFLDVKHSQVENRYAGLGITDEGRKLFIIFTIRNSKIRVISARDMNQKERKLYEQK